MMSEIKNLECNYNHWFDSSVWWFLKIKIKKKEKSHRHSLVQFDFKIKLKTIILFFQFNLI